MNKEMQKEYYKRDIINYLETISLFSNHMKSTIDENDFDTSRKLLEDCIMCVGYIYKVMHEIEHLDSST